MDDGLSTERMMGIRRGDGCVVSDVGCVVTDVEGVVTDGCVVTDVGCVVSDVECVVTDGHVLNCYFAVVFWDCWKYWFY